MPRRPLASLGALVREKRDKTKLREAASEIGISPATLLRVESGRIPDVVTFGKLCHWLGTDPSTFLGTEERPKTSAQPAELVSMSAHFKADRTPKPETIQALAKMLLFAANPMIKEPKDS
ncbi:MAG TPA: helix-turn-helix transcriptional regulator [Terriglobia bacterium]|nr:helix-turn-helix transcriptional regulator [Terriglobia bacterium]